MTTLEAAEQFGTFTEWQARRFLLEHNLDPAEAQTELGDRWLDAVALCQWAGY